MCIHQPFLTEMTTTEIIRNIVRLYIRNALYFGRQNRLMLKLASEWRNSDIALGLYRYSLLDIDGAIDCYVLPSTVLRLGCPSVRW